MIIFLSGSINSGKTTIAKILVNHFPETAHIEVDTLNNMVDWMPLEKAIPLNLKNTLSLALNFIDANINAVITYPLNKPEYEFFNRNLPIDVERFFFTLSPLLNCALTNRGSRELTEWEINRVKYHYQTGINKPDFGITIDNTIHTPRETADEIFYYIEQRNIRREMED